MQPQDDELISFGANGALALPTTTVEGYVDGDGAKIWFASFGEGKPVVLLHGGLGHGGNWGYQVPALVAAGYQAIVIDSRGHGRSTRDSRPFSYLQMSKDAVEVMNALNLPSAAFVGWSDGACTSLVLASNEPDRVDGVFYFACNMDPSGPVEEIQFGPTLGRCFGRHQADYKALSPTPDDFDSLNADLSQMQKTQPNYSKSDLAQISVPVVIVHSEFDEFIKRDHAVYLSETIPNAYLIDLPQVSHFAPLQRPDEFNAVMIGFLDRIFSD